MKKAKKLIPLLLCLCLILSGCAAREAEEKDSSKLQIVCTNFPAYDFAREIAGNRAQIKLLIKPGAEVHYNRNQRDRQEKQQIYPLSGALGYVLKQGEPDEQDKSAAKSH